MDSVNNGASVLACKLGLEAQELLVQTGVTLERITRITTDLQLSLQLRLKSILHLQGVLTGYNGSSPVGRLTPTRNAIEDVRPLVRFSTIAVSDIRSLIGLGHIDLTLRQGQMPDKTLALSLTMQRLSEKCTALDALIARAVPHRDLLAMKLAMQAIRTAAEGNVSMACLTAEEVEQLQFQVTQIVQLTESIAGAIY